MTDGIVDILWPTFVTQDIVDVQLTFVSVRQEDIGEWLSVGQALQYAVHEATGVAKKEK